MLIQSVPKYTHVENCVSLMHLVGYSEFHQPADCWTTFN